jgi:hypothetical protein
MTGNGTDERWMPLLTRRRSGGPALQLSRQVDAPTFSSSTVPYTHTPLSLVWPACCLAPPSPLATTRRPPLFG